MKSKKKKRIGRLLTYGMFILLGVTSVSVTSKAAYTSSDGKWKYDYYAGDDTEIDITGYCGADKVVTVPAEIDGCKVIRVKGDDIINNNTTSLVLSEGITSLYASTSISTGKEKKTLTSLTIPKSLASLDVGVLDGCTDLTTIKIADGNTDFVVEDGMLCAFKPDINDDDDYEELSDEDADVKCIIFAQSKKGNVTIPNDIREIDECAFRGSAITSVTIPNTVDYIGFQAFMLCDDLTTVKMNGSIDVRIDMEAFAEDYKLKAFDIPNNARLDYFVFAGDRALSSVSISQQVTIVDEGTVFAGCSSLKTIQVDSGNTDYSAENGFLYNKGKTTLYCAPGASGTVELADTVTAMNGQAFFGSNIEKLVLPDGFKNVFGSGAFWQCPKLTDITIPNSLTKIGDDWYPGTKINELTYTTMLDDYDYRYYGETFPITIHCGMNSAIYKYAKANDMDYWIVDTSGMEEVELPEWEYTSYEWDGDYKDGIEITNYNGKDTEIVVPEKVDGYPVVELRRGLFPAEVTKLTIPTCVTHIYDDEDDGDTIFDESDEKKANPVIVCEVGSRAYSWARDHRYTIEVTGCTEKYVLDENIYYELSDDEDTCTAYAFKEDLADQKIVDSVTVGSKTYKVNGISSKLLYNSNHIQTLTVPNDLSDVYFSDYNDNLDDLRIICKAGSITDQNIDKYDYGVCYNAVSDGYIEKDGIVYKTSYLDYSVYGYMSSMNAKDITIPSVVNDNNAEHPVRSIDYYAFAKLKSVENITIEENIKGISRSAFEYCSNLKTLTIKDAEAYIVDGEYYPFLYLPSDIVIYGVADSKIETEVNGVYCFKPILSDDNKFTVEGITYCIVNEQEKKCVVTGYTEDLPENVTIPAEITKDSDTYKVISISAEAFKGASVTTVTIADEIARIGQYAFADCTKLESLTLSKTVTGKFDTILSGANKDLVVSGYVGSPAWNNRDRAYAFCNLGCVSGYYEENGLVYSLSGETCSIIGYVQGLPGDITIPAKVTVDSKEYTVNSIGNALNGSKVTSIIFADGVKRYLDIDCKGMTELASITLPEMYNGDIENISDTCIINGYVGTDYWDDYKGERFHALGSYSEYYKIQDGVVYEYEDYDDGAVYIASGCTSDVQEKVVIPDAIDGTAVYEMSKTTFVGCSKVKTIQIPAGVESFSKVKFTGLDDVTIICMQDSDAYNYAKKVGYNVELFSVETPVTSINLSDSELELKAGETKQLIATVAPENASYKGLRWESSSDDVWVDQNGNIKGFYAGKATITVKSLDGSKVVASCEIIVKPAAVESISFEETEHTVRVGSTIELDEYIEIMPDEAYNTELVWSSDDRSIANVSDEGVVKALKVGATTIRVKVKDQPEIEATCEITVIAKEEEPDEEPDDKPSDNPGDKPGEDKPSDGNDKPSNGDQNQPSGDNGNQNNNTGNNGTTDTTTPGTTTSATPTTPAATQPAAPAATAEAKKQAAVGTVLDGAIAGVSVKVTSDQEGNPTVEYTAVTNKKAKAVTIPDSVTVDGITYKVTLVSAKAFAGCKKLTKITIGANVTTIGKNAFKNCKGLKTITIKSTTLAKNAFAKAGVKKLSKKVTIKVPKSCKKDYKKQLKKAGFKGKIK